MNKNIRLEDNVLATLHVSTTKSGKSLFVLEGTIRGPLCRILINSGASDFFCKSEWVREHQIPTVFGQKYRIEMADGSITTTRQRLRNKVLTVGTLDICLDAIMTKLNKFDIILGQSVNPDIYWSTKTIRDRKTGEAMVHGDEYTVHVAVHHLEADAMAKLLRQQPTDLFVIGLREVQDAVDDINTDQQPEWTTSLRDSLNELRTSLRSLTVYHQRASATSRLTWSAMNHIRSEHTACHRQNSERFTYNYKIYSQKVGFVRQISVRCPNFICTQEGWYHAYVRRLSETQRPYEETPYTVSPD
jgi:hypothetical protein